MPTFSHQSELPFPAEVVFDWHRQPGAFARLNPPWDPVEPIDVDNGIEDGSVAEFRVPMGPLKRRWVAEHRGFIPGRQFQDVQLRGPFAEWRHTHTTEPDKNGASRLIDEIEFRLPFGFAGRMLGAGFAQRQLRRVFQYRHAVTRNDLTLHSKYMQDTKMKVLVSGSSGLVGTELCPMLTSGGHQVARLTRPSSDKKGDVTWQPSEGEIDAGALEGFDAVVHLAGENIGDKRWSDKQKIRIRNSRVDGTRLLSEALAKLDNKPQMLICASATGYYGDRGDEVLTEHSEPGSGFLPEVCIEWEAAADPARAAGIRVVHLRFGVVVTPKGGALAKMLFPFKMCVGGKIGSGKQYWSWIALDDVLGVILHAIATEEVNGPVNVITPNPVTNYEFTKTLGSVLSRPTIFPMPAFAARLALGEMANDLLLASTRAQPAVLEQTGYEFQFPELEPALRHVLGRPKK